MESVCEMLAYESLEKCKEDLLGYNLSIQTVSSSCETSKTLTRPNFNNLNGGGATKNPTTSTVVFEIILDCKSCSTQNL